ncbi:hypothetical protein [Pyrolobus fumarii]|uniref:hypothetical protein n=1 Tax=Pyrolobus fumarii TaxID=54252 RepID=UPI001432D0EF|nr:hypothetical protein [Pyrolobus fumarii]
MEALTLARLVHEYYRYYGRPLAGRRRLIALLAALKYLEPDGTPRRKALPLNFNFYITCGHLDSSTVKVAIIEAIDAGLVQESIARCYDSTVCCDDATHIYVYKPRGAPPLLSAGLERERSTGPLGHMAS